LFGSGAPVAKTLLGAADPQVLAGLLYLGSGIALGGVRLLRRGTAWTPASRDATWLASAIVLGGVVAPLLLLEGLSRTTASSASLVLVLEAPLTALFARLFFGEHLGARTLEALALITLGAVATVTLEDAAVDPLGLAAVALASACWALDNNFTREVAHGDAVTIAALKGLVGGAVNVAIALRLDASWPSSGTIIAAGASARFRTARASRSTSFHCAASARRALARISRPRRSSGRLRLFACSPSRSRPASASPPR
jgi:drug/metabolite transporter (DMT)-like permease